MIISQTPDILEILLSAGQRAINNPIKAKPAPQIWSIDGRVPQRADQLKIEICTVPNRIKAPRPASKVAYANEKLII